MRMTKALLVMVATSSAALGFHAPASAQPNLDPVLAIPSAAEREQTTNRALLEGLLRRRIEISRSGDTKASRAAVAFIDERIAQVLKRAGR